MVERKGNGRRRQDFFGFIYIPVTPSAYQDSGSSKRARFRLSSCILLCARITAGRLYFSSNFCIWWTPSLEPLSFSSSYSFLFIFVPIFSIILLCVLGTKIIRKRKGREMRAPKEKSLLWAPINFQASCLPPKRDVFFLLFLIFDKRFGAADSMLDSLYYWPGIFFYFCDSFFVPGQ